MQNYSNQVYARRRNNEDLLLDRVSYTVGIAGVMGRDTNIMEMAILGTQLSRLLITPQYVDRPNNETAKILFGLGTLFLGQATGNKRVTSACGLLGSAVIDYKIRN